MQIMPVQLTHTAEDVHSWLYSGQIADPETNINIGTSYPICFISSRHNCIFPYYNADLTARNLVWQQRRAHRCGIGREYSVLRDAVMEERAIGDAITAISWGDKPTLMSACYGMGRH